MIKSLNKVGREGKYLIRVKDKYDRSSANTIFGEN